MRSSLDSVQQNNLEIQRQHIVNEEAKAMLRNERLSSSEEEEKIREEQNRM